jgi:hypothetical protein
LRAEDKEVDGPELERDEKLRGTDLEEQDEEEVEDHAGEQVRETNPAERTELVAAMRQILARQQLVVNDLHLPQRELRALDALKAAVEGRDAQLGQFVYASDRKAMLEQALAILQPNVGDLTGFHDMIRDVANLRHGLRELEDAQDELLEGHHKHALAKVDGDTDDKPKPKPDPGDTSLTGPERKEPAKVTSLLGPEIKEAPKLATTLVGPEIKEAPKPATTLTGPEVKDTKPASTLSGPERPEDKEQPEPPSSLGDPVELEAQKKKPWWKRPFG